jgi:acyl carrier protein
MVEQLEAITEAELRRVIKQEIARLTDGRLSPDDIADDEPLFTVPGEHVSRIELDSLDALELSFAIEQATGIEQPQEAGWEELLTVDAVVQVLSKVANDDSLSSESCAQGGE